MGKVLAWVEGKEAKEGSQENADGNIRHSFRAGPDSERDKTIISLYIITIVGLLGFAALRDRYPGLMDVSTANSQCKRCSHPFSSGPPSARATERVQSCGCIAMAAVHAWATTMNARWWSRDGELRVFPSM